MSDGPQRRTVLRGAAATVGLAGLPTVTAGQQSLTAADRERVAAYSDPRTLEAAVNGQTELLGELAADGVLAAPRIGRLDGVTPPTDGTGELLGAVRVEDGHTPRIDLVRPVEGGRLSLSVLPEKDTAAAVFDPDDAAPVRYGSLAETGCTSLQQFETAVVCCERDSFTCVCLEYCP